jgi:predicted DNA-binding transcriptional regulator AlpA
MNIESSVGVVSGHKTRAATVTISPWVNETLPDIHGILSSRDLARLTRRSRWVLCGLALIGKFPRKKRYRGRLVGWCRAEVLEWMTRDLSIKSESREGLNGPRSCARRHPQQACLPLECGSRCTRAREYSERPVRGGPKRFADDKNQCKGP